MNSQSGVMIKAQKKCLLFTRGWAVIWVWSEFAGLFEYLRSSAFKIHCKVLQLLFSKEKCFSWAAEAVVRTVALRLY